MIPLAVLAPLIGSGLSFLSGLFGKNKANNTQNQGSTNNSTQNFTQTNTQNNEQIREIFENPMFAGAREMLLPMLFSEFQKANKPTFGPAQSTKFMSQLNDLTDAATNQLKQTVAGTGGLQSGRFAGGVQNIERAKLGEAVNFYGQLPFLENQTRNARTDSLMGLAMNWLGRAPTNEKVTGNTTSDSTGTQTGLNTGTQTGQSNASQGGGWGSALDSLLNFGGGVLGDVTSGRGGRWGINRPAKPSSTSVDWWDPLKGVQ
jgi:hypothetical protein